MVDTTFPRITTKLVMPGQWVADNEWYRFWELLWLRTGGDQSDSLGDIQTQIDDLVTGQNQIKAYTLTGTEILINGTTSRQLLNAPLDFSLATTGVTPGVYGDASNSISITVDSKGRVTDIEQVPTVPSDSTLDYLLRTEHGVLLDLGDGSYLSVGD